MSYLDNKIITGTNEIYVENAGWMTYKAYRDIPYEQRGKITQYNVSYIQYNVYPDKTASIVTGQCDITAQEYETTISRHYHIRLDDGTKYKSGRPERWYLNTEHIRGTKTGLKNAMKIFRIKYADKAKNGKLIFSTSW
jgi:creatinine amidohydrolase/Fe(II)-dependent formamide hydrolase-like protein